MFFLALFRRQKKVVKKINNLATVFLCCHGKAFIHVLRVVSETPNDADSWRVNFENFEGSREDLTYTKIIATLADGYIEFAADTANLIDWTEMAFVAWKFVHSS